MPARPVEEETPRASLALPRLRRWTSGGRGGITAIFLYLLGAVVLTIGAWSNPRSGWAGNCCDQQQTIWYLGWTPHALAHGLDPFFTTQIGAPAGVNLMWNTPMTLLGLIGWLPAQIGGRIFGFNVLMICGIALSGFTAWLVIRRWTGDGLGPIVGGAVYAFSPYVASHAALHLNLATAWVPPLILLVIDELLVTRRHPPWRSGIALGIAHNIGSDETVLVAPYFITGAQAAPMLWAAETDYGLRMPEAYAYMPQPDGRTISGPPLTRLAMIMLAIQDDETPILARGETRAQVTANLRDADVRHVIVGPMQGWPAMLAFFTDLFGREPERVDEIAIWRNVNVRGVVAAPGE
ncbi:hypothetical protein GAN17_16160 [Mycobacterium kubicae]|uniref:hypothetical protein n=1 Tax=Mycobacterium kubicae TaxID=120959 RepID=UPI001641876F|nr:hypothetical protein [Mycobacterium kubicae]QNI07653.1 hypothetical protein GAN17_16160 [Mycobacterium kubicae]